VNMNIQTLITESPINAVKLASEVESVECGAVVTFSGNVRNHDKNQEVLSLTYEIHPSSAAVLEKVVQEICLKHAIANARVAHRYGPIHIGETALFVAVSAPHRQSALIACTELIDEIKLQIPIWKHQTFADGTDEWVNSA
jgi:molybdopterin synthase catalytic subunit